ILGTSGQFIARSLRKLRDKDKFVFARADLMHSGSGTDRQAQQILNLINYAKTSGTVYDGRKFPAGYLSLDINGLRLRGQRNPKDRLGLVPFDFSDKTVLDIGCNQGGMLFSLAGRIRRGV